MRSASTVTKLIVRHSLLLACTLAAAGCQLARPPQAVLPGTSWRVEAIGASPAAAGVTSTLEMDNDAGITGHGGCNPYVSEFAVDSRSIRFGEIFAAEIDCPAESLEQEKRFFSALAAAREVRVSRERLVLLDESGEVVLRLRRMHAFE